MSARHPPPGKALDADEYAARHDAELGFEQVCLEARLQCNLRQLLAWQPRRVLEVSCGPELLAARALPQLPGLQRWVVVEPAQRYADGARALAAGQPRLTVLQAYVEQAAAPLQALAGEAGFDAVLVSGLLHETAEPLALLRAAAAWLAPAGRLLASVPNAGSFHRLLAVEMGLVGRPDALGERNRLLGQPTVFDHASLAALLAQAGLVEEAFEGYLFKPLTHPQMATVAGWLGPAGTQALIELGRRFPEQAAEICILARRA